MQSLILGQDVKELSDSWGDVSVGNGHTQPSPESCKSSWPLVLHKRQILQLGLDKNGWEFRQGVN